MPYPHAHPTSLQGSGWAPRHMSTSSASSYGQSSGLLDITNRSQQHRGANPQPERPRPRMRQLPLAPLGTREDVENENYESPLSTMFHRAYDRYRTAEEARSQAYQADQFLITDNDAFMPNPLRSRQANVTDNFATQQEFPEQFNYIMNSHQGIVYPPWVQNAHAEFDRRQRGLVSPQQAIAEDAQMFESLRMAELRERENVLQIAVNAVHRIHPPSQQPVVPAQTPTMTFDTQPRPPPKASEDMIVNIACTICAEHPINVILLPCWHACMCNFCADLCVPTKSNTPYALPPTAFTGKCPKCRANVKERREIFLG